MRVYHKSFRSETPATIGESWHLTENGKLCERWDVVSAGQHGFTVKITEHFAPWRAA